MPRPFLNCVILLIEYVNANSKEELLKREAHFIRTLKCVNKLIPLQTKQEYYEENKDKNSKAKQEYYVDNKVEITKRKNEYRANNKDKTAEMNKIYKIKNQDKLLKRCDCDCGGIYIYTHKARHFKSETHCKFINSLTSL